MKQILFKIKKRYFHENKKRYNYKGYFATELLFLALLIAFVLIPIIILIITIIKNYLLFSYNYDLKIILISRILKLFYEPLSIIPTTLKNFLEISIQFFYISTPTHNSKNFYNINIIENFFFTKQGQKEKEDPFAFIKNNKNPKDNPYSEEFQGPYTDVREARMLLLTYPPHADGGEGLTPLNVQYRRRKLIMLRKWSGAIYRFLEPVSYEEYGINDEKSNCSWKNLESKSDYIDNEDKDTSFNDKDGYIYYAVRPPVEKDPHVPSNVLDRIRQLKDPHDNLKNNYYEDLSMGGYSKEEIMELYPEFPKKPNFFKKIVDVNEKITCEHHIFVADQCHLTDTGERRSSIRQPWFFEGRQFWYDVAYSTGLILCILAGLGYLFGDTVAAERAAAAVAAAAKIAAGNNNGSVS